MWIAMAGLPGTGKSTLASRLADAVGGVVLCKDVVRGTLFPPAVLDYSADQDDVTMRAIYAAAAAIRRADPGRHVVLDGRTFSRAYQVRDLLEAASAAGAELRVIECVCADEVARVRLARDAAAGTHPAANRTPELHALARARAEPLSVPRLVLDTGETPPDECLARAVAYLTGTTTGSINSVKSDSPS